QPQSANAINTGTHCARNMDPPRRPNIRRRASARPATHPALETPDLTPRPLAWTELAPADVSSVHPEEEDAVRDDAGHGKSLGTLATRQRGDAQDEPHHDGDERAHIEEEGDEHAEVAVPAVSDMGMSVEEDPERAHHD